MKSINASVKPRARLLVLLGDQLIRDAGVAVFELVKNAFDADSPSATVTMLHLENTKKAQIIVEDAGVGMTSETVVSVWLEPGTDYRLNQKNDNFRTARFKRVPIGEKGVGRFAAHKLGSVIRLITRHARSPEVVVEIDWDKALQGKRYLDQLEVKVVEREPEYFKGSKTGTRIEITGLRDKWTREMVRNLARAITAISSPFMEQAEFHTDLVVKGHEEWLEGLLSIREVLRFSLYKATCLIKGRAVTYKYEFTPFSSMDRIKQRTVNRKVLLGNAEKPIDLDDFHIGPITLRLFIFDSDSKVLRLSEVSDRKGLKAFLHESGGVRVYRGGIRVYDYGERGNDWLGLGGRRVNIPTKRLSNNQIIGVVSLDIKKSVDPKNNKGLIEKTNREGFVENADFEAFRDAVGFAVQQIEVERNLDKTRLRNAYASKAIREPVVEDIAELRQIIEKRKLTGEVGPYLDRIESDYVAIRDRLLTSATTGLSLSVVIHEVEKGISELSRAVDADKATNRIKALAKHLAQLIEGYGALVRRSGDSAERANSLVSQALFNVDLRLRAHQIEIVRGTAPTDFSLKCSRRLVISTIMNLIDNSIWWLDNRWGSQPGKKKIFINVVSNLYGKKAIVVADNGPGFIDPPELLIEPFVSRKPDGMGLGLHIADEVMKAQRGSLEFPDRTDVDIPRNITGAIVALCFKGA